MDREATASLEWVITGIPMGSEGSSEPAGLYSTPVS